MTSRPKVSFTIPEPPKDASPQLRQMLLAMKEAVEVRLGRRGDPLEQGLTKRDLVEAKLAKLGPLGADGPLYPVEIEPAEARITPPAAIAFQVEGVFGGIMLTWDTPYDQYNVHAYTEVWRAETNDPNKRVLIDSSRGNTYFDRIPDGGPITFYYWIRFVSEYNRVGPFSQAKTGTKLADTVELLDRLSGEIDESILAQGLRERINLIDAGAEVPGSVANIAARIEGSFGTLLETERVTRSSADSALASQITTVAARVNTNTAAIQTEQTARANADSALASQITTVAARVNTNTAAIQTEQTARASADSALASQITTLQTSVNGNTAAIQTEQTARANADSALASRITTLQTSVNGNTAAIQTQATVVNGLSAQYMVKLDVNGYVSGYGLYNSGGTSQFLIHADRFAIGRPGVTTRYPFIVDNGQVVIDTAVIRDGSIQQGKIGSISFGKIVDGSGTPVTTASGLLRADRIEVDKIQITDANIAGVIKSNRVASNGQPRWMLDKNGGMTLNGSGSSGRMEIRDNVIKVFDSAGRLRVQLGDLTV